MMLRIISAGRLLCPASGCTASYHLLSVAWLILLVCAGDILTLTATGASTYFWTSDEAEIICAGTCETAEIIATTDATIEVIGTNDYGLSDTITFNITLLAIPEIPEVYLYEFEIDDYGCLEVIDPDLTLTYTWWLVGEQIGTG